MTNQMDEHLMLNKIIEAALDVKALDLTSIDMRGKSSMIDFAVICHGTSSAHTQGISERISLNLKKEGRILPLGVEGHGAGEWILMDYNSVIVHIFQKEMRELYNLEELYREITEGTEEDSEGWIS